MANEKPISKDYLLTQFKNYETEIIDKKYVTKDSVATTLEAEVTDEQVASALLAKTELDKKIDKTSIATTLSSESTNDEVVGAKLAYDELQKIELATKEQFATASGEAISVNDSVDGKIRGLKLYGKSEQKQYSGKNLLNATLETTEKNGVTCTANGDGTYTLNGMMTGSGFTEFMLCSFSYENGKMYKICGCPDNGNWGKYGIISSNSDSIIGVDAHDYGNGLVFTPKQSGTLEIQIRIWAGVNADKLTFKPMLVDATLYPDTTYDDFEPYTGGIPSPNPNYPQEIKSVANPVVRVYGENMFDVNVIPDNVTHNECTYKITDDNITINATGTDCYVGNILSKGEYINNRIYIPVKSNTKYRVFITNDLLDNSFYNICDSDKKAINNYVNVKANNFVITTDKDTCYINLRIGRLNSVAGESYTTKIFVYEPYTEQTATLPYTLNAIPVERGGNVTIDGQQYIADYVDFEKKKLVRRVKKKDLGEFDWNYVYNVNPKLKYFDTTILDSFKPTASHPIGEGFCDSYSVEKNNIPQSDLANNKVAIGWLNLSSTRCCLEIRDDNYTNALDFKNAVKGRYIYYPLATQETIDLTDEEVHAFKELSTYYPTTNVFVASEQLNGYADVKYPTTDVSGIVSNHDVEIEKLKKADTENFNALEQDIENQFSTASGDYITVNDSVDGNIVELGIKGNSFQQTYSGKNLFDCATMFPTSGQANGITLTNNGDGTFKLSGTATANAQIFKDFTHEQTVAFFKNGAGIYTLSTQELPTAGNVFQCTLAKYNGTDSDYTWRSSPKGKAKSYNITQEMLDNELFFISFMFYIQSGSTINQTFTPQVEFGSSATEYEAYCGGIPSPNPSYPQEINSVGDDGSLVVKSCGKNLAKNANLSTSLTSREVTFVTKSDGTIVVNGTPTQATDNWVWCTGNSNFLLRKGKYLWTGCPTNDGSNKYRLLLRNVEKPWKENNDYGNGVTFELTEDKAFCFFVGISYGYVANNLTFKPMLRRCDDNWIPYGDDIFEPYHETTTTIPLSEPLRAIGDIKDEITYQDGKWGVLRRIKEINLTDLAWELVNNDTYQYWRYSVNDGKEASSYNTTANILAEKYMASSWYNTVRLNSATNAIAYGFNANNTSAKIVAVHNGSTTESPTGKFLYELITPTFEPFADQTLPYLSTYDGVTNISNDDALSAEMTVKYPTTDASGVGSKNEAKIAELENNKVDKCTVSDVPYTLADINSTDIVSGSVAYTIKNGMCNISMTVLDTIKTGTLLVTETTFPTPVLEVAGYPVIEIEGDNTGKVIGNAYVDLGKLYVELTANASMAYATLCYIVKE